jgi:hypothetical protein
MKRGDLVFVVRGRNIEGKTAFILEILPLRGLSGRHCHCLIEGKFKIIPVSWLEVIDETG